MRIWTRDNMNWIDAPEGTKVGDVVRWAGGLWKIVEGPLCVPVKSKN